MLELGPCTFAKRARYLWPPSAVHSAITRVKLSVKCTALDIVRLSTCSINYIKSNNFHWSTWRHFFFTEGYSLDKSWLSEASCFSTWAVKKKKRQLWILFLLQYRGSREEECLFLYSLCLPWKAQLAGLAFPNPDSFSKRNLKKLRRNKLIRQDSELRVRTGESYTLLSALVTRCAGLHKRWHPAGEQPPVGTHRAATIRLQGGSGWAAGPRQRRPFAGVRLPAAAPSGTAPRGGAERAPGAAAGGGEKPALSQGHCQCFLNASSETPGSAEKCRRLFACAQRRRGTAGCGHPPRASPVLTGKAVSPATGSRAEKAEANMGPPQRATLRMRVNPFVSDCCKCGFVVYVHIKKTETAKKLESQGNSHLAEEESQETRQRWESEAREGTANCRPMGWQRWNLVSLICVTEQKSNSQPGLPPGSDFRRASFCVSSLG